MLYHLFSPLSDTPFMGEYIFNVFQYVTFRSVLAFICAILISIKLGPAIIRKLKSYDKFEESRAQIPNINNQNSSVPSMGGIIPLLSAIIVSVIWNDLTNSFILIIYLTSVWLGLIGFVIDYRRISKYQSSGQKHSQYIVQIVLALFIGLILYFNNAGETSITLISIPFLKDSFLELSIFFIPLVIIIILTSSTACSVTDGIDGLATGLVTIVLFGLGIMSYIKGNIVHADHLQMDYISEAGELTVYISGMTGALLGFLWYNAAPAEVHLGKTGSYALGGNLAVISILLREEIFLMIISGVFIIELLSSFLQTGYFRCTRKLNGRGIRLLRCAPLHHHYELKGIGKEKLVARFWIIALLFLAAGLATIKLR